jgi:hypothetical protein
MAKRIKSDKIEVLENYVKMHRGIPQYKFLRKSKNDKFFYNTLTGKRYHNTKRLKSFFSSSLETATDTLLKYTESEGKYYKYDKKNKAHLVGEVEGKKELEKQENKLAMVRIVDKWNNKRLSDGKDDELITSRKQVEISYLKSLRLQYLKFHTNEEYIDASKRLKLIRNILHEENLTQKQIKLAKKLGYSDLSQSELFRERSKLDKVRAKLGIERAISDILKGKLKYGKIYINGLSRSRE